MIHELKIWPGYFESVCDGSKAFEVRKDDRSFNVGDHLLLREWGGNEYTGRVVAVSVSCIVKPYYLPDVNCDENLVVMGIKRV